MSLTLTFPLLAGKGCHIHFHLSVQPAEESCWPPTPCADFWKGWNCKFMLLIPALSLWISSFISLHFFEQQKHPVSPSTQHWYAERWLFDFCPDFQANECGWICLKKRSIFCTSAEWTREGASGTFSEGKLYCERVKTLKTFPSP